MFGMKLIYDQTGQMQDIQKIFLIILHKQYHQNLKNLSYIVNINLNERYPIQILILIMSKF